MPRPYLVLACHPDHDSLWLEWPNAFGARWSSLVLRSQGWAVTVLRGYAPTVEGVDGLYTMRRARQARRAMATPFCILYS